MPYRAILPIIACLLLTHVLSAQPYKLKPIPENARRLYAHQQPRLSPAVDEWARRSGAAWKDRDPDVKKIKKEVISSLGNLASGDVMAMCFIVLMEATSDQDKDLETIMAQVQQQQQKKQGRRYKVQDSIVLTSKTLKNLSRQKNDDGLSDMTETEQMSLQMIMDRRSKFEEAISNIMKKISDTDSGIISNMK